MKYYYSVYNLDKECITNRVFLDGTNVYKYDTEGNLVETYYAVTEAPVQEGKMLFKSVNELGEDDEEYFVKFNPLRLCKYKDGKHTATDYMGNLKCIRHLMDEDVLAKAEALPYRITYYSNKPYGRIVGVKETEWQGLQQVKS